MVDPLSQMFADQERALASIRAGKCGCWKCFEERGERPMHMVVCPACGNKRCPKANNHANVCTNSNEPGQPGSAYPP
jgi:hypothetical protein